MRLTALATIIATSGVVCALPAFAQGKLGAYTGTVNVSSAIQEKNSAGAYAATVKIAIPMENRNERNGRAEVDDSGKPSATATITKWETSGKDSSPDSGGNINTWSCSLAAPAEVAMNAQGAIDLDYRGKKYAMYVALAPRTEVTLDCTHSRSGAYRKKAAPALFIGTALPQHTPHKTLPLGDPARLAAKYKLEAAGPMLGNHGPIEQEWDLRLEK
jgi:hypothetical protein